MKVYLLKQFVDNCSYVIGIYKSYESAFRALGMEDEDNDLRIIQMEVQE